MSDAILVRDVEAMAARLAAEGTTHETTVVWPSTLRHRALSRVPPEGFYPFELSSRALRLAYVPADRAGALLESAVARERYEALRRARARVLLLVLEARVVVIRIGRNGGVAEPEIAAS